MMVLSHISLLILQLSVVSRLKHDNFVELIGYCLEAENRILVYQHASLGSLHDVLHGRSNTVAIQLRKQVWFFV